MNICKCGLPLRKITVATIPGSIDTKFAEIEVCDNWLEQYHDDEAAEHPQHPTGGDVAAESEVERPASG